MESSVREANAEVNVLYQIVWIKILWIVMCGVGFCNLPGHGNLGGRFSRLKSAY